MADDDRTKRLQAMLGNRDLIAWLCPVCKVASGSREVERNGRVICERCARKLDEAYSSVVKCSSLAGVSRHLKLDDALLTFNADPENCLSIYIPSMKVRFELLEIEPVNTDIYVYTHSLIVDAGEERNISMNLSGKQEAQIAADWFISHRFNVINGLDMFTR